MSDKSAHSRYTLSQFNNPNLPKLSEYYKIRARAQTLGLGVFGKKEDIQFEIEKELFIDERKQIGGREDLRKLYTVNLFD